MRKITFYVGFLPYIHTNKAHGTFRGPCDHVNGKKLLQVRHRNNSVVQPAILDKFLSVPAHDALVRCERVGVDDGWGAEEWDIWSVEVSGIQY